MAQIVEVSKIRSQYKIRLDTGEVYRLSGAVYAERPLKPDDEVDPEEFSRWVLLRQYRPALERAVSMLAARACSRGEIIRKLKTAGYHEQTVDMVIFKLEKEGLLNDREFTEMWVSSRTGQKYGPHRILRELKMKGVDQEDAEEILSTVPEETQMEQAVLLAKKGLSRAKPGEDPRKTRQRVLSAIVRRGYDWDLAYRACERVFKDLEEE